MTKALLSTFALASIVAGCGGREAHDVGPLPTVPSASTVSTTQASPQGEPAPSTSTPSLALCSDRTAAIAIASREGAAGTIRTVWRVKNTGHETCRSFGYPGMDFHTAGGWRNVQVQRGGYPDIDGPPRPIVVPAGQSFYFVSYWGDVDTQAGPCRKFDRVKLTLPDNFVPAKVSSSGCVDPLSVDVGPVTTNRPS